MYLTASQDALFIATLLCHPSVADSSPSDRSARLAKVLDVYHDTRHTRGRDVQRTSRQAGMLYEFCGVHNERDDIAKLAKELDGRMRWIWEWDATVELAKAVDMLSS